MDDPDKLDEAATTENANKTSACNWFWLMILTSEKQRFRSLGDDLKPIRFDHDCT